jgi:hypothetical protein
MDHVRGPHINPWLVVIGLAAALVALGSWVIVDRVARDEPDNLATSQVAAMLGDRIADMNAYDAKATANFYAKDAVMDEFDLGVGPNDHLVTKGRAQILERWQFMFGALRQSGVQTRWGSGIIQIGRYHAATFTYGVPGEQPQGQGIAVMELDPNGKIAHEWAISGAP